MRDSYALASFAHAARSVALVEDAVRARHCAALKLHRAYWSSAILPPAFERNLWPKMLPTFLLCRPHVRFGSEAVFSLPGLNVCSWLRAHVRSWRFSDLTAF